MEPGGVKSPGGTSSNGGYMAYFFPGTVVMILLFTAIFYMTGSARYLFAAMPPFVLLFYRRIERLWGHKKLLWMAGANLALGTALSWVGAASAANVEAAAPPVSGETS